MKSITRYSDDELLLPSIDAKQIRELSVDRAAEYYSKNLRVNVNSTNEFTKILSNERWMYWDYLATGLSEILENQDTTSQWEIGFGTSEHYYVSREKNSFIMKRSRKKDVLKIDANVAIAHSRKILLEVCSVLNFLSGYSYDFGQNTSLDDELIEYYWKLNRYIIEVKP